MPEAAPRRPQRPGTRQTKLTGRAALLAVVLCAIALSLAYPLREYIAQRRQLDQLVATQQSMSAQVKKLQAEQQRLTDPAYIESLAEDQLHMCMPDEKCYVVIGGNQSSGASPSPGSASTPWYSKVWQSVQQANQDAARAGSKAAAAKAGKGAAR